MAENCNLVDVTDLAPIVLFVYNRMEHTKQTIEALKKNSLAEASDLYIFADGPKKGQEEKVEQVRQYIKTIGGFKSVHITEREKNFGLANSVIAGVTEVVEKHGKIIVLEDDIVCTPDFLEYMNCSLIKYQMVKKVFAVTGYSFFRDENVQSENEKENIPDTYFLQLPSSWSWGTWKDRWAYFDAQAMGYKRLKWNRKLRDAFNYDNTYDYYSMLMKQMKSNAFKNKKKQVDSWAVRWYWSIFKQGGLTLFPRDSFVENVGFDGSGTNCTKDDSQRGAIKKMYDEKIKYEDVIEERQWIRDRVKKCLLNN
jgi:hypothetical protein